ncbi:MAG: type IX secretion system sortase PorU [Candidatus Latescibacteria bacterium]|nr:type IX secretion system sortase PorU [Candidatus Latescibacterota bacterium]
MDTLRRQTLPDRQERNSARWHPVFLRALLLPSLAFSLLILTALPVPLSALTPPDDPDVRLVRADLVGVVFEYVPDPVQRDTVSIGGERFDVLTISRCPSTTDPGRPQMPERRVLIGLPPGAAPSVTVLDAPYREQSGYRLAPAPGLIHEREELDGIPRFRNERPDRNTYAAVAFIPEQRVTIGRPAILRGRAVLPLFIAPLAYSPATGRVRLYDRIRVEVRFNLPAGPGQPARRTDPDLLDPVYRSIVLNADAAAPWTSPASPPITKPVSGLTAFGPGDWFKVQLTETGFYRLDTNTLQAAGFDVNGVDPRTIRLYNGGSRALPQDLDAPRPVLTEVPIVVAGEQDGRFDSTDSILFYGVALSGWDFQSGSRTYTFYQNPYTDTNVYWLTAGDGTNGKRVQPRSGQAAGGVVQTDTPVRRHEERELVNPLDSGTEWFWQLFDGGFREEATYRVDLGTVSRNGLVTARFRFQGKTQFTHYVQVFINGTFAGEQRWGGESIPVIITGIGPWLKTGTNDIRIVVPRENQDPNRPDHLYFDWFELSFWKPLEAGAGDLAFAQDPQATGPTVRYQITGAGADAQVYDVTDPLDIVRITTDAAGGFQDSVRTGNPTQYHLTTPARWKQPVAVERDSGSNLRSVTNSADYLIVAHDEFVDMVTPLKTLRETKNGLQVFVARTSDIYDEFAWGLFDPTAIRDFLRYATFIWSSTGRRPAYVLLVGDGTYDYKNHSKNSRGNWVPPFESGDRCTDDWFVYFDGNGNLAFDDDIYPDMAIGRLAVQSRAQADIAVRKIVDYETHPEFGVWRNTIVLTADDERTPGQPFGEPYHTGDTERLAQEWIPRSFNVEKVYLTEYPLDAAGEKPAARDALLARLNDGALLVNYVGHGSATLWAHEHVFNLVRDLPALANGNRLPMFFTATCTAGRFDLVTDDAMAEELLRTENRGAVAFVGATRLSFPSPNIILNRFFYEGILQRRLPIGSALMAAKIQTGNRENSEKYLLFGDPTMALGAPAHAIRFTPDSTDTLRVLQTAAVHGEVIRDGATDTGFTGTAFVQTLDSARDVTYITAEGGRIVYQLPGSSVFRGSVAVERGTFAASFIVPRDITYGGDRGRVSVYAWDGQTDGSGAIDFLPLRGSSQAVRDSTGPAIEVSVDGRPFVSDDFVSSTPALTIVLFDESGINITGEVGHQITVQTDGDARTRRDVTGLFVYETGNYQRGSLTARLPLLTPGTHTVTIKAWDNVNNPSAVTLVLSVVADTDLRITNAMNYPNPFTDKTTLTFELTQDADVTVRVYTVAGTLIQTLDGITGHQGFNQIDWDGLDRDGDRLANGTYLYRVTARSRSPDRKTVAVVGRMIVMR